MTGAVMEAACRFFEAHLTDDHRRFLGDRYGFSPEFVARMRIGYAPPVRDGLLRHLLGRGCGPAEVVGSGLVFRWSSGGGSGIADLFRGRIVFPYLDGDGGPAYCIGRATDETPGSGDRVPAKYKKQLVTGAITEPIFGTWSVVAGAPVVVTEGVTDALAVLQAGRPCISPVTTRFKHDRVAEAAEWCRQASSVVIVNDAEASGAGLAGAAKTAIALLAAGVREVRIGELPRPPGTDKVDLNDFMRAGGDLDAVLAAAVPADGHPAVRGERRRAWEAGVTRLRSAISRERWQLSGPPGSASADDIEDLKCRMPSVSAYTGIAPGKRGPHPVYGSTNGDNFAVSPDGETWTSFHGGADRGKSGNIFKLIALEQGFLSDESQPLRGEAFLETVRWCRGRW
ncbi:MAG: DNA primase [Methanomicrobiales archaeon]